MKSFPAWRKSCLLLIPIYAAFVFFAGSCSAQIHAAATANTTGNNSGGVGRGDNGQLLRVTVTLAGKPQPGVRVKVTVADGSVVVSGLTAKNGTYIVPLDGGVYTVTATTLKASATSPVTIVKSTDPALVSLTLAPTH